MAPARERGGAPSSSGRTAGDGEADEGGTQRWIRTVGQQVALARACAGIDLAIAWPAGDSDRSSGEVSNNCTWDRSHAQKCYPVLLRPLLSSQTKFGWRCA
jgi:hypothetical protein